MKVLVACEESGTVRDAFIKAGHQATSCDLQPSRTPGPHYQGDIFDILYDGWDMMIAHPPCTYLSYAGIGWFNIEKYGEKAILRHKLKDEAIEFFMKLWRAPIERICIENPRGFIMKELQYTQMIHPWQFGDSFSKPTLLWLKNLPKLVPTNIVDKGEFVTHVTKKGKVKRDAKWFYEAVSMPPAERARFRSKTFQGIADAMADQWGKLSVPCKQTDTVIQP